MIKKSMIITTIICCGLISKSLFSQEKTENKQLKFIGIESGFEFLSTDIPEFNFIRGDISYYGIGSATDYLETSYQEWYVGAKTEFRFLNDKCGVLTGFRYTKTNSYISKGYDSDYFYLLNNQDNQSSEFLRIKKIDQYGEYFGIPLEIRYLPFRPRLFRLYFGLGAEFNYLLSSSSNVIFQNDEMEIYENDVLDKFGDPSKTYISGYISVGWNLNWKYKTYVSLEAKIPTYILSNYTTGLVNPLYGTGLQLNIQLPF